MIHNEADEFGSVELPFIAMTWNESERSQESIGFR
jgi:hypothetical protein